MPLRANKWRIWSLVVTLLLGAFFIAKLILHKAAWDLAVPYLATFVAPVPIFVLVASWLRKWEVRRPPPKLLALCWSLSVAVLVAAVNGAIFYYATEFHLIDPTIGDVGFVMAACVLSASIPVYYMVLPVIVARAAPDHP